jgi:hypothetical protein
MEKKYYYNLKIPAGSYNATGLPTLLWTILKHRVWHLFNTKKWMD